MCAVIITPSPKLGLLLKAACCIPLSAPQLLGSLHLSERSSDLLHTHIYRNFGEIILRFTGTWAEGKEGRLGCPQGWLLVTRAGR